MISSRARVDTGRDARAPTHGFTLLELIIVLVVIAVAAAVTVPLVRTGFEGWFSGRDLADAARQATIIQERWMREARMTEDFTHDPADPCRLEMTRPDGGPTYTYSWDGAQVRLARGGEPAVPLGRADGCRFENLRPVTGDDRVWMFVLEIGGEEFRAVATSRVQP